ncbi:MAG TPA: serine/threonine-protein kinase, partial [Kofleriaceae bacterium]|nr:serine/threonine-protein kinase [Kofleriaceae bacterium]
MARAAAVAVGAVFVIGGGAALGYAVTRKATGGMTERGTQAMGAAIGELDGDIKAARTALQERARTIAGLTPVQSAIATNRDTAHEMVERGELKFETQPGEVLELVQVTRATKAATQLFELPDGAPASPHASKPGSYVEMTGARVVITEVTQVAAKYRADELDGYVVVSRPLDLQPAIGRLVDAGITGRFDLGDSKTPIGTPPPGAVDKAMPLPSQPEFQLVVAVPAMVGGMPMPIAIAGGAGALVGLVLVALGMRKRAPASGAPGDVRYVETQVSGASAATGTPVPGATDFGGTGTAKPVASGTMIGRWEVVRRLGSGGMADVYLARARGEAGFEKLVAIKVMHPHLARNPRAVDHFLDEARLAARITHPNVVAIQDLGKIDEDYVIVMEYVDGVDLERLLINGRAAKRQVPIDVALGILCRICDGLHAAHKATAADGTPLHLVHRDVKSANVLVSKQGGVKVVDFGIAKAAKQSHMTIQGETKGTPSMMAPEQRVGEQVDVRADVYSVGAVAYEILTGAGVNLDLAALAHLGIENWPHLPPPSALRPQLPFELDKLLLGAMAFERDKRPADCAAFEASLAAIMKQHG